jgi:hypothetical protein
MGSSILVGGALFAQAAFEPYNTSRSIPKRDAGLLIFATISTQNTKTAIDLLTTHTIVGLMTPE